ncbi:haloacid dehalogenase-like hydrolase domain-containing protein 3 [Corythoichthys intestinalis]|uniref:haloacid dehalogenase-like hydrolase domain-containing protein 3 n=1 Tax=Corythoichthys intestinalis TaxID=161448 RepID=UPI0025A5C44E|nr:haloacid dehalogenase-like hydrolase domain-containing protein 3 [Corythoichthys intestinalis]XP_057702512.1 haloacid dehalogenase-like hydrolase domain-containing protein 3 [Corythoichthys intestinalis]XP_061813645.1 haloacid dehalogenase-like hydrolase domain-containing protein 3 [Nerophis lumbriciformis]
MRAPLRWVLWDVKDTLLRVRSSVGEQYCDEAKRMGLSLKPAEVDAAFRQAYRHHSRRFPNYGISQGLDGQSWWTEVVKATFSQCRVRDPVLLNEMALNLYKNFCNADNWEVFPDTKSALEKVSSLGLKMGVVSNFDNRLEAILRGCGLLSHFNFLLTSEAAGVEKPHVAIFDQARRKCDVLPTSIVHVGDHYTNDYLASRSAGIHGFLLDRTNNSNQHNIPKEHLLSSLDDLPARLQQHMEKCS